MSTFHWLDGDTVFEESIEGSPFKITCDGKRKALVGRLKHRGKNFALAIKVLPSGDPFVVIENLRKAARKVVAN